MTTAPTPSPTFPTANMLPEASRPYDLPCCTAVTSSEASSHGNNQILGDVSKHFLSVAAILVVVVMVVIFSWLLVVNIRHRDIFRRMYPRWTTSPTDTDPYTYESISDRSLRENPADSYVRQTPLDNSPMLSDKNLQQLKVTIMEVEERETTGLHDYKWMSLIWWMMPIF